MARSEGKLTDGKRQGRRRAAASPASATSSWREIDAQRGKSRSHSRQDDPAQQRIERSASYQKYKAAADSLFTGGELPQGLAEKFDPDGKRKTQKQALQKLQQAESRQDWVQGVIDYLDKYPELPEDAYFLDSLLDHPRERIADKALAKLEAPGVRGQAEDEGAQEPG